MSLLPVPLLQALKEATRFNAPYEPNHAFRRVGFILPSKIAWPEGGTACDILDAILAALAAERRSKVKYPIERLSVGETLFIKNPRRHLRGSLYNRAEIIGIRVTCRKSADGALAVRRVA